MTPGRRKEINRVQDQLWTAHWYGCSDSMVGKHVPGYGDIGDTLFLRAMRAVMDLKARVRALEKDRRSLKAGAKCSE